ncbi:MAG: CDP-alcohol phosphatidyltransferase family protein [Crocinitomicaceae bacterium]|nr:CDP-alcohol phosphatidyltransferase family protein [Crocinitomicaceae bacterium]
MFNIPNLFTAGNLLSGVCSIILAFSGQLELACYLIYFAAILDFFDGFLARLLNQKSELGKQLDSLADMVTFGVAPGILVAIVLIIQTTDLPLIPGLTFSEFVGMKIGQFLHLLSFGQWQLINWLFLAGLIIPFFSLFRLAKFNIDTRQSESFIGLPTPANTIFFTAFPLLMVKYYESEGNEILNFLTSPWVFIALILIMSLLLVAELPLFSLKFKTFTWKGNEVKFIFLISCLILIPLFLAWSILIIITLYLILSIIENKRKNSKHEI